jgi:cysteine synthase
MAIIIEKHQGINVLRDDLLKGGTKSVLMPAIVSDNYKEYVYASPVYGGFQIALSAYCQHMNKKATIFCAKRKVKHANTMECERYGATIIEIPYGYLNVVEKHARDYCLNKPDVKKIIFGANTQENKLIIAERTRNVIKALGKEPDEIWCAIGSGTLISGILLGVGNAVKVVGVQVGGSYTIENGYSNLEVMKYDKPFSSVSKMKTDFPSMPNYDLKAFELCVKNNTNRDKNILFWNVL